MSMFQSPEEHAANPPETWQVVKKAERSWDLQLPDGSVLGTYQTKKAATADKDSGHWVTQYEKDGRWYAGITPPGWKSWAEVKAENEGRKARQVVWKLTRGALERIAGRPLTDDEVAEFVKQTDPDNGMIDAAIGLVLDEAIDTFGSFDVETVTA